MSGVGFTAACSSTASRAALDATGLCATPARSAAGLSEQDFRDYIAAFNRSDFEGFGRYYHDDVVFEGRGRHFKNRDEVLSFYRTVKARMRETITIRTLVVGTQDIAAELETELHALADWPEFVTGPVRKGETIRSQNFVWYRVADGRFTHIRSARYRRLDAAAIAGEAAQPPPGKPDAGGCDSAPGMSAARFAAYIDAFNRDDKAAYGEYYADDVELVIAGKHVLLGREAIFDFYRDVKSQTRRTIQINAVIAAPDHLAAELQSEFLALDDLPDFAAGPMKRGARIFINTFVFYDLRDGKFARIRSAEFRKIARP